MATLTIRDLDDTPKQSLRIRAAHRNHSMAEEARQILRAALVDRPGATVDLARRIRARFAGLGDVSLPIADRRSPIALITPNAPIANPCVRRRRSRPISLIAAQIAAIALCRGAGLATRKVADFEGCGLVVDNPWNHRA